MVTFTASTIAVFLHSPSLDRRPGREHRGVGPGPGAYTRPPPPAPLAGGPRPPPRPGEGARPAAYGRARVDQALARRQARAPGEQPGLVPHLVEEPRPGVEDRRRGLVVFVAGGALLVVVLALLLL